MTTHHAVAANWAAGTGKGWKGFNMYYVGRTIYSYGEHFPIARRLGLEGTAVFMTTENYSVSTAKHKTITRRAVIDRLVFNVPNVMAEMPGEHLDNHLDYGVRIKDLRAKADRARKYGPMLNKAADDLEIEAAAYKAAFIH